MAGNRSKSEVKLKSLQIGGSRGDIGLKITREGLYAGSSDAASAPAKIELDGTNNLTSSGNFTDLVGAPSSYVASAILQGNATADGLKFSGATISDGSNTFTITKGTAVLTVVGGTNWLGSLQVGANTVVIDNNGNIQPATNTDVLAANNSIYYSSTTSKLCYRDPSGSVHTLY